MRNNPRLTHLQGVHDPNDHIIDAEFEEIDDSPPADQPRLGSGEQISLRQWFRQQNWLIEILVALGIVSFGLFLAGFVLGSSPSRLPDLPQAAAAASPIPDVSPTAVATPDEALPIPNGLITEGNCHMGECTWANIEKQTVSEQPQGTKLVVMNILGGTSPDTGSKSRDRDQIVWNDAPHQVYAYCSLDLPATMTKVDGKWQVDIFDFTQGIPDILFNSVDLYSYACHGKLSAWSRPDFAQRYGYKAPAYNEVTIEKPEDITSL